MKQNWEYKKLEDCIEKVKYTTKIQSSNYRENGSYPIISQDEDYICGYWNEGKDVFKISKPVVIFGDHTRIVKYVDFDFVLGADGVKILQPIEGLDAKFLYFFIKSYPIPSLGYSRHFKVIKEIPIPVPPLSTQTAIVSELDALSAIIADHKSLLKKYDELEQSIFYYMFGDPVKNDKGWEVKTLSEVVDSDCSISYGIVQPGDGELSGVPVVRPVDLIGTYVYPDNLKLTTAEISNQYKRSILKGYEILMCVRGTTGVVSIASNSLKGCNVTRGIVPLAFREYMCTFFMFFQFKSISIKEKIAERTYGATLKQINMKDLRELQVIVPPLPLQQEFASKIEAIEAMKADTKKSLAKSEELFNARMDYYFNA